MVSLSPPGALFNQSPNCLIIMPILSKTHFGEPWNQQHLALSMEITPYPHPFFMMMILFWAAFCPQHVYMCAAFNRMGYAQRQPQRNLAACTQEWLYLHAHAILFWSGCVNDVTLITENLVHFIIWLWKMWLCYNFWQRLLFSSCTSFSLVACSTCG